MVDVLHVPDLILKLNVCSTNYVISLTTYKMVPGRAIWEDQQI